MKNRFLVMGLSLPAFVFACLLATPIQADSYSNGQVLDGYTYRDGFWWKSDLPYSLKRTPVYDAYRHNCIKYYRNSFDRAAYYKEPAKAPVVVEREKTIYKELQQVKPDDKDWRQKILEIAEKRDEQKAYLEAINALGFSEIQQTPQRNVQSTYNPYAYRLNQTQYSFANQGNTVYGYSLGSLSNIYGDNQVGVWMQQYARGQQHAQDVAEKGLGGMLQAIELEGSNRARVATILAKAELLKSLDTPETFTKTQLESNGVNASVGSVGTQPNQPVFQAQNNLQGIQALFQQKCYNCHSGTNIKGGVDLSQYGSFNTAQKTKVWESVKLGKMPEGGPPLTVQEMAIVLGSLIQGNR